MRTMGVLRVLGVLLVLLLVGAAACSDDNDDEGDGGTPSGTSAPAGDVPGVSDTEVKLGTHTSLTGPIAAYRVIPDFTLAYFDYINSTEGGVNNRTISYERKDDAYSPTSAVTLTRQLVEQDHIFAMFNALGTPNHLAVIDYLQQNGVPDMYVATGASEWVKDPSARPQVFGSNPNYVGEGVAMGKYIAENYPGQKVGVVYQNDDFGQDGLAGLKIGVGDMEVVGEEPYEVTDVDLSSQVDRLNSAGADVVAFWATPLLLGNAIKHARADINWDAPFLISSVSMNELTAAIASGNPDCGVKANAPDCNIDGVIGPVATYMHYQTSIPGVAKNQEIMQGAGMDPTQSSVLTLYAQYVAEMMVETLKQAAEPLTRESLVAAAEGISDWTCSICLFPVTLGPNDHDPSQSIAMGSYQGGQVVIMDKGYTWEGVNVADLTVDTVTDIDVPADALTGP